jgi:GNAT superfamily N-acetyltransferase
VNGQASPAREVRLAPLGAAEFDAFAGRAAAEYATDKVRAGQWRAEAAQALARQTLASLLPAGPDTAGHHLFVLQDAASGRRVGTAWLQVEREGEAPYAYLNDIRIDDGWQGQGYGRAALAALEAVARGLGCGSMQLHAFGHNLRARRLYERAGYRTTNVNMRKDFG